MDLRNIETQASSEGWVRFIARALALPALTLAFLVAAVGTLWLLAALIH